MSFSQLIAGPSVSVRIHREKRISKSPARRTRESRPANILLCAGLDSLRGEEGDSAQDSYLRGTGSCNGEMLMKRRPSTRASRILVALVLILGALGATGGGASVQDQVGELVCVNQYFFEQVSVVDGKEIAMHIIAGPPQPPHCFARTTVSLPEPQQQAGINTLLNVPAFNWSFGCSATSAAMISGYYDRVGYWNMYAGPTNGGVMPMDNSSWPDFHDGTNWRHQCPLSATHNGLDGRTTNGHVDDYWISYGSGGPDPFVGNWPEHTWGDCTADFMKTNMASAPYSNTDGETGFWNYTDGSPLSAADLEYYGAGYYDDDGGYGHKLFYESRGYTVVEMYNQYIYGYKGTTLGFTYDQYKAEIDAGRPVMIHVEGHTMVGVGYDDSTNTMYIHDTWDYSTHTMTWGGTYSDMLHYAVTIVKLTEPEIDIRGLGNSIPDGDTNPSATDNTDFGNVDVGDLSSHTFTIHSTGVETLELTGSPTIEIGGTHAADFTVTSQPGSTSLAPAGSMTFTIEFTPGAVGVRTATVTIDNTDLNENPYTYSIQGTGTNSSDTTPPTPDPMTWDSGPSAVGAAVISMTATTATDPSGVEYYFEETTGNPGGDDSGWQDGSTYSDDGLQPYTEYCYRVKARDKWANQSETTWSSSQCVTLGPPETSAVFRVDSDGRVFTDSTLYGAAFHTGAADVAEWVSISEPVTAGSVVELDPDNPISYRLSSTACSPWVAGVISTEPGFVLGLTQSFKQRALLALVGIVPTYVTDEGGPIQPGDLLVSSSTRGHAMRWVGGDGCQCSLVGKALEPMEEEPSVILVLLTAH